MAKWKLLFMRHVKTSSYLLYFAICLTGQAASVQRPDFTCTADYFHLVCTWDIDDCSLWSLFYRSGSNNITSRCSNTSLNIMRVNNNCHSNCKKSLGCIGKSINMCSMARSFGGYYNEEEYEFYLTRCDCNKNHTWTYHVFTNNTILKFDIKKIILTEVDTTSANLTVTTPQEVSSEVIRCNVTYYSECNSQVIQIIHHTTSEFTDVDIRLEDLHPYTNYTVEISCKIEGSDYWGDKKQYEFQTQPDGTNNLSAENYQSKAKLGNELDITCTLQLHGPMLDRGSFLIYECGNGIRCLALYWKAISTCHKRGVITGYSINVLEKDKSKSEVGSQSQTIQQIADQPYVSEQTEFISQNVEYSFLNISIGEDKDYNVEVYAVNEVGLSVKSSSLYIASRLNVRGKPLCVNYIRNDSADSYCLSYRSSEISINVEPLIVTFYWCYGIRKGQRVDCMSNFNWKTSENNSWINVSEEYNSKYSIHFAVSLSSNNISSGMVWTTCSEVTFSPDSGPSMNIKIVIIEAVGGTLALVVLIVFIGLAKKQRDKFKSYDPDIQVPNIPHRHDNIEGNTYNELATDEYNKLGYFQIKQLIAYGSTIKITIKNNIVTKNSSESDDTSGYFSNSSNKDSSEETQKTAVTSDTYKIGDEESGNVIINQHPEMLTRNLEHNVTNTKMEIANEKTEDSKIKSHINANYACSSGEEASIYEDSYMQITDSIDETNDHFKQKYLSTTNPEILSGYSKFKIDHIISSDTSDNESDDSWSYPDDRT